MNIHRVLHFQWAFLWVLNLKRNNLKIWIFINPLYCVLDSSYPFANKESIGSELGNSFASNIRIKEEPLDDEYDKAMAPQQGLLDRIKDEPDNAQVNISPFFPLFLVPHMNYSFKKGSSWLRSVLWMGWEETPNEGWGKLNYLKNNSKESTRVTGNFFPSSN